MRNRTNWKTLARKRGIALFAAEQRAERLEDALRELLSAVTSKAAVDTRDPIAWSGSPAQNRRMYAAIDAARDATGHPFTDFYGTV